MKKLILTAGSVLVLIAVAAARDVPTDSLSYTFTAGYGQVEAGGRYAGAEFHQGRPLPSRISFYYPVANSIDLTTDYWRRAESRPLVLGISVNGGKRRWLGKEPWECVVSPHRVEFHQATGELSSTLGYEFCMNEPALVFTVKIRNITSGHLRLELYSHLKTTLRTCQTYARMDSASTLYDEPHQAIVAMFDQPQTGSAAVVVQNTGISPDGWTASASELAIADSGWSRWIDSQSLLLRAVMPSTGQASPAAAFTYSKWLDPGDSLVVVQVISSSKQNEREALTSRLATTWRTETGEYDAYVRSNALRAESMHTGDAWIDKSAKFARAILASNAHFINGQIVPMPCPAEYNFFFTHDVLLTDLAAVNFDTQRVKKDLLYIASLAKDNVIPHAYYWRDDGFKTEWCTPDNWNHLWFVITTASYLRHSLDTAVCTGLYPLLVKSLREVLTQRKGDGLMYAFRPDWWDLGRNEGPRAYITILTIRALRDFTYLSSMLGRDEEKLLQFEQDADEMESLLSRDLWDDARGYLMNYNGAVEDTHYYMGSLLATVFGVLQGDKANRLLNTAMRELVDPRIGVRNVMPPDFHLDSVKSYFKIADNEAGDPYLYANGGVWLHANAWYAIGLVETGRVDEAFNFFRQTMTVEGIMHSPMGQPAMYEYRYSDPSSPEFGRIDKPLLLWGGGFYLKTLYRLLGVQEMMWNLSFAGQLPSSIDSARFTLAFGQEKQVRRFPSASMTFVSDGREVPSLVIPLDLRNSIGWELRSRHSVTPQVREVNAVLHTVDYNRASKNLQLEVSSFAGHKTAVVIAAPRKVKHATLDGKTLTDVSMLSNEGGNVMTKFQFEGSSQLQSLKIQY